MHSLFRPTRYPFENRSNASIPSAACLTRKSSTSLPVAGTRRHNSHNKPRVPGQWREAGIGKSEFCGSAAKAAKNIASPDVLGREAYFLTSAAAASANSDAHVISSDALFCWRLSLDLQPHLPSRRSPPVKLRQTLDVLGDLATLVFRYWRSAPPSPAAGRSSITASLVERLNTSFGHAQRNVFRSGVVVRNDPSCHPEHTVHDASQDTNAIPAAQLPLGR